MPISSIGNRRAAPRRGVTLMELMVVMAIISLIVAVALPNTLAGLENLRLSTAARSVAAFMNVAANRAERREQGVELIVSVRDNAIAMRTADSPVPRTLSLPPGIVVRAVWPTLDEASDAPREFVIQPGSIPPRVGIELANPRGARRIVRLDPITGVAQIEQPS